MSLNKTEEEDNPVTRKPDDTHSKSEKRVCAERMTIDLMKSVKHMKHGRKTSWEDSASFFQRTLTLNSHHYPGWRKDVERKKQNSGVEVIDLTGEDEHVDPVVIAAVRPKHNYIETTAKESLAPSTMVPRASSVLLNHKGSGMGKVLQQMDSPIQTLGLGQLAPGSLKTGQESPKRVIPEHHDAPVSPNKRPKSNKRRNNVHSHSSSPLHDSSEKSRKDKLLPALDNSPRRWEFTNFGRKYYREECRARTRNLEFSVMSYNILAQDLLEDNMFLYQGCRESVLDWKERKNKIMEEIKFYKPDILCLQEVNCKHYEEFFVPKFEKLGYHGVFKQRTGGKLDGCAIIYNQDLFEREEVQEVEYLQRQFSVLDRDNVGLIVKLKQLNNKSAESLFIVNTHLLYNPARGDIKLAQLMLLLAEVDRVSHAADKPTSPEAYSPIIICGDFNSTPSSDIYKFLTQGHLKYENLLAGQLSGQRPGCTRNKVIVRDFFPRELGISDQCQYVDLSFQRTICSSASASTKFEQMRCEMPNNLSPDLYLNQVAQDQTETAEGIPHGSRFMCQNSGYLNHHLNLESVYHHRIERLQYKEREVTTQHGQGGCIVDYVLYNVLETSLYSKYSKKKVKEGNLKVLARLGLLSGKEVEKMGNLPNEGSSSSVTPGTVTHDMSSTSSLLSFVSTSESFSDSATSSFTGLPMESSSMYPESSSALPTIPQTASSTTPLPSKSGASTGIGSAGAAAIAIIVIIVIMIGVIAGIVYYRRHYVTGQWTQLPGTGSVSYKPWDKEVSGETLRINR